jgi:hypothetical protein
MKSHGGKNQVKLCPIQERSNGLVGFKASEDKKMAPKQERPFEI